jgi:hypothetical protein
MACEDDKALPEATLEDSFIRFSFQVNQNDEVLVFPSQSPSTLELSEYTFQRRDTLKIPVVASSNNQWSDNVIVDFSTNYSSDFIQNSFQIMPDSGLLEFTKDVPSDTITVIPLSRFENLNQEDIVFNLNSVSNTNFNLGYPRDNVTLDQFTLNIGNTQPIAYTLQDIDFDLNGDAGESITFDVTFDQLVSQEDINGLEFLTTEFVQFACDEGLGSTFEFDLVQNPISGFSKTLTYDLTLIEDAVGFSTTLNIRVVDVGSPNFTLEGNTLITATTPEEPVMRSGDPASNWYNTSNIFYRTYGKAWYFNETDQACDWQDYATFTRPVDVPSGSDFDNGQGFHKYKIGFRNIIANPNGNVIGTNPFNFRRFYDGATFLSSAYNQVESIEFFPDNGTDPNQGSVKVVSQTLVFIIEENDVETQINVPICGSGTYQFNSAENRWEMFITIIADETEINGNNNAEKKMFIYTENNVQDPPALNENCPDYIEF